MKVDGERTRGESERERARERERERERERKRERERERARARESERESAREREIITSTEELEAWLQHTQHAANHLTRRHSYPARYSCTYIYVTHI